MLLVIAIRKHKRAEPGQKVVILYFMMLRAISGVSTYAIESSYIEYIYMYLQMAIHTILVCDYCNGSFLFLPVDSTT